MAKKVAIVLFNLGGPDSLKAVKPFLFNLFNDPAIIDAPTIIRYFLAKLISTRRNKSAKKIYKKMGGRSPILSYTEEQASALYKELTLSDEGKSGIEFRCFIAMRYWHPFTKDTVAQVHEWGPDEVHLMPLYPQFSTTTSNSSIEEWKRCADAIKMDINTKVVYCYPTLNGFVDACAELTIPVYSQASQHGKPRILFSAHGLPKKIIDGGDPYQWQIEQTTNAVIDKLKILINDEALDFSICYQSRVGPLEWIGPSTEELIIKAAEEKVPIIIVPIAFVSEHSETLVELDIEYKNLAQQHGCEYYYRVPAVATNHHFIKGLKQLSLSLFKNDNSQEDHLSFNSKENIHYQTKCPDKFSQCPHHLSNKNEDKNYGEQKGPCVNCKKE